MKTLFLLLMCLSVSIGAVPAKGGEMKPKDFLYEPDFEIGSKLRENEISIKWFGTAAFRIEFRDKVLWIDPWFSRQSLATIATRKLKPIPKRIDPYMDRADYIVIGHSHYDHAADLPYIVPKTGAKVVGSVSTANLLRAHKIPDSQIVVVRGGDSVELAPFKVTFIHSIHGKIFGRIPSNFDIAENVKPPLKASQYGCGEVFGILIEVGGWKIYHQGSAGLVEETLQGIRADIVLLGISSRSATPLFVQRIVRILNPQILIPMHYDYFFKPLSRGFSMLPTMKFGDVVEEARRANPDVKIITLPLCGEFRIKAK